MSMVHPGMVQLLVHVLLTVYVKQMGRAQATSHILGYELNSYL